MMELVRDVLDKRVVDRNGVKMGRADGIVAELRPDGPPKLIAIEIGSIAMARRIGVRTARLVAWLVGRMRHTRHPKPYRVPWSDVCEMGLDIRLRLDASDTPVHDWQTWLREKIVDRIPGAQR